MNNNIIYHINYGVILGFPALRKAVTTHVKRYDIFSRVFDIANQLLARHSPFSPLCWVDEWTVKPWPFSIQGRLSEFLGLWLLKNWKSVLFADTDVQTFLEWEENQSTKRKTKSYAFSGFGNGISRVWEQKSTAGAKLVELPLADFGTVREIFLLSMRTKSITENFFSVKSTFIVVFVIIQHIVNLDVRPYDRTRSYF